MIPDDVREAIHECAQFAADSDYTHPEQCGITVLQWLSTLPQRPRADWNQAPEWAMWWACDANGCRVWYAEKPFFDVKFARWYGPKWDSRIACESQELVKLPVGVDWRTLIEKRPD